MAKSDKLLMRIKAGKSNVRIEDIVSLMTSHGFENRRNVHSYMFYHPLLRGHMVAVAIPHGRENKVLKGYVNSCVNAIEQLMEVQDE